MEKARYSLLFLMLALTSACGKSQNTVTTSQSSTESSALVGSWRSDCVASVPDTTSETPSSSSSDTLFQLNSDGTYQELIYTYLGSDNCAPSTVYDRTEHYGTMTENSTAILTKVLQTILAAPLSAQAISDYDSETKCGYSNWTLNVTQSCAVNSPTARSGHLNIQYQVSGDNLSITTCGKKRNGPPACHTQNYQRILE